MTRSTNAPQNYVQLLQFSNDFINSVTSTDINDIFVQLMLVHKWGNKFMSPEQLFEIDRMHTELYRKYTDKLRKSMIYMRTGDCWLVNGIYSSRFYVSQNLKNISFFYSVFLLEKSFGEWVKWKNQILMTLREYEYEF